ncbi:MAG: glycine zipper 2TM domain-containing protein, partial [Gammaproteobacteria bacterium]
YHPGMTPAEQRLAQQSQAYNDTQLEGCLLGAGAGLVGACTVGNCKLADIVIGMAVGAAVGCTAGTYLANVQKGHGTAEEQLNVVINDVRRQNQDLVAYNQTAQNVIAENKLKLAQLQKDIAAGRKSRAQAKEELVSINRAEQTLQTTLTNAKKKRDDLKQAANAIKSSNPEQRAVADQEVKQLEQQVATLESNLQSLTEARQLTGLG